MVATLVDVVGGLLGVRILRPDWMATADMTVQLVRPAVGPFIEARVELVRRGRTTMVLEAMVVNVTGDGSEVLGRRGSLGAGGLVHDDVRRPPGGNRTATQDLPFDLPTRMEMGGAGLRRSLLDTVAISVVDAAAGRVSLPVHPYVHNSIGAVQGGAMALLGDVAATEALGAATGLGGAGVVVTDLQVAYLTLGRVGPIVTRATVLDGGGTPGAGAGGASVGDPGPASAVVELIDTGAGDRLTTVVNARAMLGHRLRPAPGGPGGDFVSGFTPPGPVDLRRYMNEYFRLERWEIPPAHGEEGFSEFGGRMPLDDHHRGAGGGMRTGAVLTNLDSVGGFLAGLSVLPRWIVTTSLMATVTRLDHRGPLRVHGRILRRGRNSVVAGLEVVDEGRGDALVAASTGTFAVLDPGDMARRVPAAGRRADAATHGRHPTAGGVLPHRARRGADHPAPAGRPPPQPVGNSARGGHGRPGRRGRVPGGGVGLPGTRLPPDPLPGGRPAEGWPPPTPCSTTFGRCGSARSRPAAGWWAARPAGCWSGWPSTTWAPRTGWSLWARWWCWKLEFPPERYRQGRKQG